jgi:hypothetical protein
MMEVYPRSGKTERQLQRAKVAKNTASIWVAFKRNSFP